MGIQFSWAEEQIINAQLSLFDLVMKQDNLIYKGSEKEPVGKVLDYKDGKMAIAFFDNSRFIIEEG